MAAGVPVVISVVVVRRLARKRPWRPGFVNLVRRLAAKDCPMAERAPRYYIPEDRRFRYDELTVTTTASEKFTGDHARLLCALIYKRFGYDTEAAAEGYRKLLQNSCSDAQFAELANEGIVLIPAAGR